MRDPVCGMTVGPDALRVEGYSEFGFCSEHCRKVFIADSTRYAHQTDSDSEGSEVAEARAEERAMAAVGSSSIHLSVEGMTCASCVSTVETALSAVPGG